MFTEAVELMQKFTLEAQPKSVEIPEPNKKVTILVFFIVAVVNSLFLCC